LIRRLILQGRLMQRHPSNLHYPCSNTVLMQINELNLVIEGNHPASWVTVLCGCTIAQWQFYLRANIKGSRQFDQRHGQNTERLVLSYLLTLLEKTYISLKIIIPTENKSNVRQTLVNK
jgi:hypothetical protein